MVWNEPAPARRDGAAHGCYFPKPADIVFDRDIIRWIGEDHLGLFAIEEIGNYSGIECIAADKAVRSKPPEIAGLAPRWDGFRLRKVGHPPGHSTPMQLHGHDAES